MKIFTCRICGEVYLGEKIPHTCPFCGVENKYLVLAKNWNEIYDFDLTEAEKNNLKKALELELSNTAFYKLAYETLSNKELGLMFKGLSKVEREHADIFRKILKPEKDPEVRVGCKDDAKKCIEESAIREKGATEFYLQALNEAENPRLKEIFKAIMRVEQDHIRLDEEMINKLK